jgi:hypothetical protein
VVGTPGRLKDHLQAGKLKLAEIEWVIMDEADEMLNFGFADSIEEILNNIPKGTWQLSPASSCFAVLRRQATQDASVQRYSACLGEDCCEQVPKGPHYSGSRPE